MYTRNIFSFVAGCFTLCVTFCTAQSTHKMSEIRFMTGSWNDVLSEAKNKEKMIYIDFYTTWCGPCKLMSKQAFSNAEIGEKFNENFINYQIDAEKGDGIELARKYGVKAYPTSLYLTSNGELVQRIVGYNGIKAMLEDASKALSLPNIDVPLLTIENEYENGKRNIEFLAAYLAKRAAIGKPNGEALENYLNLLPEKEWVLKENLEIIIGNLSFFKGSSFLFLLKITPSLLKSKDTLYKQLGKNARAAQYNVINNLFKESIKEKNELLLEEVIRSEHQVFGSTLVKTVTFDELSNERRSEFYLLTGDIKKYAVIASKQAEMLMNISVDSVKNKDSTIYKNFYDKAISLPDSIKESEVFKRRMEDMKYYESSKLAMRLNSIALAYCENMSDLRNIRYALTLSSRSLEYKRSASYLKTYANLLDKLNRVEEAKKIRKEAMVIEHSIDH